MAAGNQLVVMKKGRTRSEADDCPICQLPLPLDSKQSLFRTCCMKAVCNGCITAAGERGMWDCPFCRAPRPKNSQSRAIQWQLFSLAVNMNTEGVDWRRI